jgi:hypothetical protein
MTRLSIYIVPGVTMQLDHTEIEALYLETMGALFILDSERAQEAFTAAESEEPETHLDLPLREA